MSEQGAPRPEVGAVVDLIPASLGDPLLCWVEEVSGGHLVVTCPADARRRPILLPVGERLDLVWRDAGGLRGLPVELAAVEPAERPRWRLTPAGVVTRGQRRDAVRAPLTVPVTLRDGGSAAVQAETVDMSEGGLRCVLDRGPAPDLLRGAAGAPTPPAVGDVVHVTATLSDAPLGCLAEVVRRHPREDDRVELSLRFIGLTERDQDRLRQQVFTRLRELRRRGLI